MKSALTATRRALLEKIRRVVFTNPFSAERPKLDAEILGRSMDTPQRPISWNPRKTEHATAQQIAALARRELEAIPADERKRILSASDADALFIRDVICFLLFHEYYSQMDELIERTLATESAEAHKQPVPFYVSFEREMGRWFEIRDDAAMNADEPGVEGHWVIDRQWIARIFAICYQIRRAYYFVYTQIVGTSPAMMRLREAVWEAIFTRNLEWYWRFLLGRMADFSTLITGPTGSGKEQVGVAICRSQYLPFNPATKKFETDDRALFLPINLAALSPTLMESELFGHVKGAFTGAVEEREGLMSSCSPHGGVFLDEIGELAPESQVKLLRVLQTRTFFPLGGRKIRRFEGRIVSATNQDVPRLVADGKMREDFYYRLSACQIRTPSLRERFEEDEGEIEQLTTFLLRRMLETEQPDLEAHIIESARAATKQGRPWRGNVRELEQFIRQHLTGQAVMLADPLDRVELRGGVPEWAGRAARGEMT
ncbi:sigma-54-dependent Fis family transcriptional regulator, partial [Candidatus Sumerlaeota bacterium]|nr:sigma-54-dependent Fis family transcriptional regulator [Candidatus Sumerlaeota bacterium]